MIESKEARTDFPISDLIANRWSPVSYSDQPVESEKIDSLIEAARWAPSSFNGQPWQYIVGIKGDEIHTKLADALLEGNDWAKAVPVLICSVAKLFFDHKHRPNRHAMHDTGMATMNLVLQATELDLISHQMGGFDLEKIRNSFNLSEDYEPASMIAIGYPGEPQTDEMKERDEAPRQRKNHIELIWK